MNNSHQNTLPPPLKNYISKFDKLANDLTKLLNESDYYDVEIRVGMDQDVKTFKAHSIILKARSLYFEAALSTNWIKRSDDGIILFEKENISPKIFEAILTYIYNGVANVDNLDPDEIFDLINASDELSFNELIDDLQNHLIVEQNEWIKQNIVNIYETSSNHQSLSLLHDYCGELIGENPGLFFKSDDFRDIEKSVLKSVLERDDLIMDKIDIWDRVIHWGVKQIGNLEEGKSNKTIESGQLSPKYKKLKIDKSDEPISEWSDDLIELKTVLQDIIPLIRFYQISKSDFKENIEHYKGAIDNELYKEVLQYYDVNEWQPMLLPQKSPTPRKANLLNLEMKSLISNWIDRNDDSHKTNFLYKLELLFRGTRDGFSRSMFQEKCYNIEKTVVIMKIKETGELVGGYNPVCWNIKDKSSDDRYWIETDKSFIFKIDENHIGKSILSRIYSPVRAILHSAKLVDYAFDNILFYESFIEFNDLALFNNIHNEPYCYYHFYGNGYEKGLELRNSKSVQLLEEFEIYKLIKKY